MSENQTPKDSTEAADTQSADTESVDTGTAEQTEANSAGTSRQSSGPTFTEAPSPLDGITRSASNIWNSMEGKSVSMRTYVGSIVGVVILMMLARCGG